MKTYFHTMDADDATITLKGNADTLEKAKQMEEPIYLHISNYDEWNGNTDSVVSLSLEEGKALMRSLQQLIDDLET